MLVPAAINGMRALRLPGKIPTVRPAAVKPPAETTPPAVKPPAETVAGETPATTQQAGPAAAGPKPASPVPPPKVFTSSDPIVGETATTINSALPGAVSEVNVPIKNPRLNLSSDADIKLSNGDVIEVKSGGGTGTTSQVLNQQQIIGNTGEVIVYGPNLKGSVIKGLQNSGVNVFTNMADLLTYIKSKGL
jgi:hypothetical protein